MHYTVRKHQRWHQNFIKVLNATSDFVMTEVEKARKCSLEKQEEYKLERRISEPIYGSSEETQCEEWHSSICIEQVAQVDWQALTVKHVQTNHSKRRTIEALHNCLQRVTSNLGC